MPGVHAAESVEEITVIAPRGDTLGLEEATATASRLSVSVLDLPASVSRIDQQSMQAKAQTNVIEAANGTTGLVGHARAGAAGAYSWRGFTENAIATLYDGIRVQGSTVTTRQYDTFDTLADLRVRYAFSSSTEASVFLFNALDEEYAAWATAAGGQNVMANIGAPRTLSAQLRMKF